MTEKTKHYPSLAAKAAFPALEQEILDFWQADDTFKKSVQNRPADNEFVFYDGPPFANGTPHYGHIMVSFVKDTVARFQTMCGRRVERRLGWDCHGLPAEMSVEKELGVSGHKAIEAYGIDKFNAACRADVLKYSGIWRAMFKRIGRWVDFDGEYKTMDLPFMESVIHNFKALYDKGLIYEEYRVQPYSWAAQSLLSNFELNQPGAYRDKKDTAVTIMFKLADGRYILAWTTTPWTLPTNLMLAVGEKMDYAVMEEDGKQYILAQSRLGAYKQQLQNARQVGSLKGKDLVGLSYEPLLPYYPALKDKGCFKVVAADFVTDEDGTGIVHLAPFGVDDFELMKNILPDFSSFCPVPVDRAGRFTDEIADYKGQLIFDTNEPIITRLKAEGKLVKKEQIVHSYPHCWRTDEPIIYKPMRGWFVRVSAIQNEMVALNEQITWVPDYIKQGRFGKWLEGARDWSISRNRFWGAPLPVWKSDNPAFPRIDVYGSIAELERDFGVKVTDLHRPFIDSLVRPNPDDPSGKSMMRRIEDVFDCWFESGSMPEAQLHYPMENNAWFHQHFPADFIVEALDQTRGWFYTLHVLGTALFHKPAFKACVCTGLLMGEGGQKLSKRLKNYPDPDMILQTAGSDALRWFLLSSSVVSGGNLAVDTEGKEIHKASRRALIPLWNAFYFFCLYANAEGVKAHLITQSADVLDTYILTKLHETIAKMHTAMQSYDLMNACMAAESFLDILNNWYIRRSRVRFWNGTDTGAFDTLYTVLVLLSQALAPLMPFISEYIYKNLTGAESVHLTDYPTKAVLPDDTALCAKMDLVRAVSSVAKSLREEKKLRNRLPLQSMHIFGENAESLRDFTDVLKDEVNVKEVLLDTDITAVAKTFLYLKTPVIGKRLGAYMKDIMADFKAQKWTLNADKTLSIGGQVLNADEYEMRLVLNEGLTGAALPDNTAIVQLDVAVSPALEKEGIARDFVRLIQAERKRQDLDVSDRIYVSYTVPTALWTQALEEYSAYIKTQVLAVAFGAESLAESDAQVVDTEDGPLSFKVEKA